MWLTLWRTTVFVNIYSLLLVWLKKFLKQIQIFITISPFKHGKKNKLSEYYNARFWDSHFFWLNRKVLYEYPPKSLKTTERFILAVCDTLCGEKQFLLKIYPLLLVWWKNSLNVSKFSSGFAPFKHGKKNKLSDFFSACFWYSHFYV